MGGDCAARDEMGSECHRAWRLWWEQKYPEQRSARSRTVVEGSRKERGSESNLLHLMGVSGIAKVGIGCSSPLIGALLVGSIPLS